MRYNGEQWTHMNSGTDLALKGVWGDGQGDIFAAGENGAILHYAGAATLESIPDYWMVTPDSATSRMVRLDWVGHDGSLSLTPGVLPSGMVLTVDSNPVEIGVPFGLTVHVSPGVTLGEYQVDLTGTYGGTPLARRVTISVVEQIQERFCPLVTR